VLHDESFRSSTVDSFFSSQSLSSVATMRGEMPSTASEMGGSSWRPRFLPLPAAAAMRVTNA
jgi:hypothetical protein